MYVAQVEHLVELPLLELCQHHRSFFSAPSLVTYATSHEFKAK